jgi:uncharacterized membrane protein YbhN (UPF0104 family)
VSLPIEPPAPPRWRRVLRAGYLLVVLVALVAAVAARRAELVAELSAVEAGPLAASVAAGSAGVGVSGLIWRRVLAGLGSPLPLRAGAAVFFVAQLGKYLPGSLWPVLAQAELGRDHGVPRRTAVAGQALFMWVHLVTGALLGLPVVAAVGLLPGWVAAAALLLLPLLVPGPLVAVMDGLLRRAGRTPLPARPSGADMAVATGWALLMWGLYGLHVHWALEALELAPAAGAQAPIAVGVFAAAWSAGFLLLIAPAGAGAREVVLVAGLSTLTEPETAFTATLVSRLVLTLADGAWGAAGLLAGAGRSR